MNKDNVQAAIAIMKRAGLVRMAAYQSVRHPDLAYWRAAWGSKCATTEKDMHSCGNAACFAGWVALAPEFHAWGGHCWEGAPSTSDDGENVGHYSIAKWLDISERLANAFVHGNRDHGGIGAFSFFYDKDWADVGKDDVIAKLELVLAGELE